eukprot:TRINITY_DN3098_c6_g1_i1.p1 TRINITY_DN3098_c6_g1~~TRINITY_DN3098_c6_g1_i1.p1  ORF type:complete len:166 (-),score=19.37 TRINITY_DN3098_c6_g1_i1:69-566(-)
MPHQHPSPPVRLPSYRARTTAAALAGFRETDGDRHPYQSHQSYAGILNSRRIVLSHVRSLSACCCITGAAQALQQPPPEFNLGRPHTEPLPDHVAPSSQQRPGSDTSNPVTADAAAASKTSDIFEFNVHSDSDSDSSDSDRDTHNIRCRNAPPCAFANQHQRLLP